MRIACFVMASAILAVASVGHASSFQFQGSYPRLIRLSHSGGSNGYLIGSIWTDQVDASLNPQGHWGAAILRSTDGGSTFYWIQFVDLSTATIPGGAVQNNYNPTIFELPTNVGAFPAGTLVLAASACASPLPSCLLQNGAWTAPTQHCSLVVYSSSNGGSSWTQVSTNGLVHDAPWLWEPEFGTDASNRLVLYYSYSSQSGSSYWCDSNGGEHDTQWIAEQASADGVNWGAITSVVQGIQWTYPSQMISDLPGVPSVRRMPNGQYLAAYEVCGPNNNCNVFTSISDDGFSWPTSSCSGNYPACLGNAVTLNNGQNQPNSSPTLTIAGNTVLLKAGAAANGGTVILANSNNAAPGSWYQINAPVPVYTAFDAGCVRYSNPILGSADGSTVMELATDDANYIPSPLPNPPPPPTLYCQVYFGSGATNPIGSVVNTIRNTGTVVGEGAQAFLYNGSNGTERHFFARASDGSLGHWLSTGHSKGWRDTWGSIGVAGKPLAFVYQDPSGTYEQHVFMRSIGNTLEHYYWYPGLQVPAHDTWVPTNTVAGDPAGMVIGAEQHVWYVDTYGTLQHVWWSPAAGFHEDAWTSGVTGRPSVFTVGSTQHLFVRTTVGALAHWWWDASGGFQYEVLSGNLVGDPVATVNASNFDVFVATSGWTPSLTHLWGFYSAWNTEEWSPLRAESSGRPGLIWAGTQEHVFDRGAGSPGTVEHWYRTGETTPGYDSAWGSTSIDPTPILVGNEQDLFTMDSSGNVWLTYWYAGLANPLAVNWGP